MNIRALVVDDERPARNELCFLLEQLADVTVVGQAADGVSALKRIGELKPDLVLLDIQMSGRTGFEVARELLAQKADTRIVFVTAYDQYAIEAFECARGRLPAEAGRAGKAGPSYRPGAAAAHR